MLTPSIRDRLFGAALNLEFACSVRALTMHADAGVSCLVVVG